MGEWIQIPFGMVHEVGQEMGILDGVVIVEGDGALLGFNFWMNHSNQWGLCNVALPILLWEVLAIIIIINCSHHVKNISGIFIKITQNCDRAFRCYERFQ